MKGLRFSVVSLLLVCAVLLGCAGSSREPIPTADQLVRIQDSVRDYPLESLSGRTAFEYFRGEGITAGWNLGNSLDSHSSGIAGETNWGNPSITQELMNGVKAAGFNIIRIPVTWMGHIGVEPDYRVAAYRLQRAAEVAEMAHNAGLTAIINLHHDGATQSGGSDLGWLSIGRASRNQNAYNQITAQYTRVWQQIAAYFQNHGEWLIFESFNELHDGNWQTCNDTRQYITLNNWNQLFVNTVRAAGGNNASRYLMVNAYCADNRQALNAGFRLPEDPAADRLILSFHYYAPHELSIEGRRYSWGTDADRQRVVSDFSPFKPRFIDNNIPVVVGESGAVLQLYPNDSAREAQARQSRADYISHVFATAKQFGLVPLYWDNGAIRGNGEKFGLLDRRTGQPNSPDSSALITRMINAVR